MANGVNQVYEDLADGGSDEGSSIPGANPFANNPALNRIYEQIQRESAARRKALESQMGMIEQQAQRYGQEGMSPLDKASILFQAAGALAAPTRSGGLMESIGSAGSAVSGPLMKAAQAKRDREDKVAQLQMARAKLAAEMGSTGPSSSELLQLYRLQQEGIQKPGETERLLQTLPPEERAAAIRSRLGLTPQMGETERLLQTLPPEERAAAIRGKLGMTPPMGETERLLQTLPPEERAAAIRSKLGLKEDEGKPVTLTLSDGSTFTATFKGGKYYNPITGKLFSEEETMSNRQQEIARDRQDQSLEAGVPLDPRDPFASLSPRERERARINRFNADTRVLQKEADEVPDAALRGEIADYRRFVLLNNENPNTGAFWGKTPNVTASAQQMGEIEAKLKIAAGKDLKGAASDRDVAMFGNAAPSTSKDLKANTNIARFGIMRAQTELDRRAFMRDYLAVNKNLQNAERAWQEYLNANPFFEYPETVDPTKLKVDDLRPNTKRLSYQEYFRKKMQSGATPVRRNAQGELIAD